MRCKCEVAVQDILPVARAMIAKKLMDVYGLSQTDAAKKMDISQPAISQYKQNIRGRRSGSFKDNPGFMEIVNDVAKRLAEGSIAAKQMAKEMCRFCQLLQP